MFLIGLVLLWHRLIGEAYGIKDWCPALIDETTFYTASNLVTVRAERFDTTRTDRVYLFTGLVFCAHCGRRMATYSCKNRTGTQYIYYRCGAYSMKRCELNIQFNQETLEKWVLDNVKHEAELYNISLESREKKTAKKAVDKSKILAKIEKLKDLYLNDLITRDIYEKDYLNLSSLLSDTEEKEKEANRKPIDLKQFDDFKNSYDKLDPEHRKAFWSRVISKIIVNKNGEKTLILNTPK